MPATETEAAEKNPPPPLRHLEDFLIQLREARQLSEHTLAAYQSDLRAFGRHLGPARRQDPATVRTAHVKAHVARLLAEGKERSTVARHLAAIKGFFRYLLAEGFIEDDPAASMRTPRQPRALPRVLGTEQVARLLESPVGASFLARRDRAILETLYSAGLRVAELVGLDLPDLDLAAGVARVFGKGRRERLALLGSHARGALRDYLEIRATRRRDPADLALFLNHRGTRLSDRSVRRLIERYLIRADLPSGVTPHTLRHSFATHLLQSGANLKEVQELLGHRHLSSTQIYTHVSPEHLRKVYESAHPRAR